MRTLFFLALLLTVALSRNAQAAPAFDWVGVWGTDERVVVWDKPAPHLVYVSTVSAVQDDELTPPSERGKPAKLPDYVEVTVRLSSGFYGARFVQKQWATRVEVPLVRLKAPREAAELNQVVPGSVPAVLVVRIYRGPEGGGNASSFRLLPNPATAPVFRAHNAWRGRGVGAQLGGLAPTLTIRGSVATLDVRRYNDGSNRPRPLAIRLDLPQGRAFGFVPAARFDRIVSVPLHVLKSDQPKVKAPFCVVELSGNFDYSPDSMTGEAFGFALKRAG